MKIVVIGNGAIGTLTSIELQSKFENHEVTLIGNKDRNLSASTAAGAMANVYAEMEHATGEQEKINLKYLKIHTRGHCEQRGEWISEAFEKNSGKIADINSPLL